MSALAHDIALGGNARSWASTNGINAVVVTGRTEEPAFRELVEKCCLEHSERLVGKIARFADRAIDRLVEFSESSDQPGVGLSATRAIIQEWVALSNFFVQAQTLHSLTARVNLLCAAREAGSAPALSLRR
jgi:hypothetical protein